MNRPVEIAGFLSQHGWANAAQTPLDADFSPRRYARLQDTEKGRAVLMDADAGQHTPEFVAIDQLLRSLGITAPEIFAADPGHGLVLMQDFGGRTFGNLLDQGGDAKVLYRRAVEVLVHLYKNLDRGAMRTLDLPIYGGAMFAAQAELFLDAYIPYKTGREPTFEESESFRAAWKETLKGIEALPQTLMLRDFMPDNLMDLPDGKTGVLDFQDAGLGPIAYDIASLCEVVRRDGGDKMLDEMIAFYHERAQPELALADLIRACRVLSAQRHMRILGVLARRAQKDRKDKLAYIPRVQNYLGRLLRNDALKPVRQWAATSGIMKA